MKARGVVIVGVWLGGGGDEGGTGTGTGGWGVKRRWNVSELYRREKGQINKVFVQICGYLYRT